MSSTILLVSDRLSDREFFKKAARGAGCAVKWATTMAAGCEAVRSHRFPVVIATPTLKDGSWKHLLDVRKADAGAFEIILVARCFDFQEWGEALTSGAFDVVDSLGPMREAVESVKQALQTVRLRWFRPRPVVKAKGA